MKLRIQAMQNNVFLFCYKAKAAKRYNNKTKERKTTLYGTLFPKSQQKCQF